MVDNLNGNINKQINSRTDLNEWLRYERTFYISHNRRIYFYIKALRTAEYYFNMKKKCKLFTLGYFIAKIRLIFWGTLFGFEIGLNVVQKGLKIEHIGNVIINNTSIVGEDCYIIGNVCLGSKGGTDGPIIGNNVELGFGSCIIGNVHIGNNIFVGAGAVVTKDFQEDNIKLAGVPAKKIL